MKKLLFCLFAFVLIHQTGLAQSIVGKWKMAYVYHITDEATISGEIEFRPDGDFTFSTICNMIVSDSDMKYCEKVITTTMNGKYEVYGKAMSIEYDPETTKTTSTPLEFSKEFLDLVNKHPKGKEVIANMRSQMNEFSKEVEIEMQRQIRIMTSGNMYRQILFINENYFSTGRADSNSIDGFIRIQ